MKFCPTSTINPHQLELVDNYPDLYVCIECHALYEVKDEGLVKASYRLAYGKDPYFLASYQREERAKYRALHERLRNDQGIQLLQQRYANTSGARR